MENQNPPINYLSTGFVSDSLKTAPKGAGLFKENAERMSRSHFVHNLELVANASRGIDVCKKILAYGKMHSGHTSTLEAAPHYAASRMAFFQEEKSSDDELHALIGVISEAGELAEALFDAAQAGEELDRTNVVEELGDILWYMSLICRSYGITMDQIAWINHQKLKARYGDAFTQDAALNRDLDKERAVLEGGVGEVMVSYEGTLLASGPDSPNRIDVV